MTTQEAIDLYNVLLDKYGSPNIEPSEILGHLNMAINEYLNRLVPDNQGGIVNFETDSNIIYNLRPLIWTFTGTMNGSGVLTDATMEASLQAVSSDAAAKVFRVMSIGITVSGVEYPVTYVFQNEIFSNKRNFFKQPSATSVKYTLTGAGFQFYPTNTASNALSITVIKTPKILALSPLVNPEFSDYVMYNVIALALKLGGVEIRDTEILQDVRLAALQNMQ